MCERTQSIPHLFSSPWTPLLLLEIWMSAVTSYCIHAFSLFTNDQRDYSRGIRRHLVNRLIFDLRSTDRLCGKMETGHLDIFQD